MKRVHAIFTGDVQGIGFRAAAKRCAEKYQITGWVQNLPDGCVELVAEGLEVNLEDLIECTMEDFVENVLGAEVDWEEYKGEFTNFEIRNQ